MSTILYEMIKKTKHLFFEWSRVHEENVQKMTLLITLKKQPLAFWCITKMVVVFPDIWKNDLITFINPDLGSYEKKDSTRNHKFIISFLQGHH